jgi:hypothetical protein
MDGARRTVSRTYPHPLDQDRPAFCRPRQAQDGVKGLAVRIGEC